MILFWTDPSAPGGWSRLERCVTLGVNALSRNGLALALPRPGRAAGYLSGRRVNFYTQERVLGDFPEETRLLVLDMAVPGETAQRMAAACRNRKVPVAVINDPGDATEFSADFRLGGWPAAEPAGEPPGMEWAILHPRFRHVHRLNRNYPGKPRRILLHLEDRLEFRSLSDLIDPLWRAGYRLRIGPVAAIRGNLKRALTRKFSGIRWVGAVECMARPFHEADAAVIAPGAAAFEAAAAGTPALYLCGNKGERKAAARLEELGLGFTADSPKEVLAGLDEDTLRRCGETARGLVDGRGLFRTLDFLRSRGVLPRKPEVEAT